jgi:hypothetical protein
MNITEQEILDAIEQANARQPMPMPDGVFSSEELADSLGWGILRARRAIALLIEAGRVERVKVDRRSVLTGTVSKRFAYRLLHTNGDGSG